MDKMKPTVHALPGQEERMRQWVAGYALEQLKEKAAEFHARWIADPALKQDSQFVAEFNAVMDKAAEIDSRTLEFRLPEPKLQNMQEKKP